MEIKNDIALIILNYNKYELTKRLVKNLKSINYSGDIVIVDNNSKNNSFDILYRSLNNEMDNIYVIKSEKNGGYAYGNNFGIKYILEKNKNIRYIGIINPDVVLDKGFSFRKLIESIEDREDIAGITPTQLYNGIYTIKNLGWKLPTYNNILISNISSIYKILDRTRYSNIKVDEIDNNIGNIDVMPGCFFIIKSDILKKIDYLDENTFLYYEENILAYKVKKYGYKFVVDLNQSYIHDHEEKNKDAQDINYRIRDYKYCLNSQKYYLSKYLNIGKFGIMLINLISKIHIYIEIPLIHMIKKLS